MTPQQQVFALIVGGTLFGLIIELIRRRQLREEYAWLWFAAGFAMFLIVIRYDLLRALSKLIGAAVVTTTLFLFALLFLILINIHYSIKISALTNEVKDLCQALALHSAHEWERSPRADAVEHVSPRANNPSERAQ